MARWLHNHLFGKMLSKYPMNNIWTISESPDQVSMEVDNQNTISTLYLLRRFMAR